MQRRCSDWFSENRGGDVGLADPSCNGGECGGGSERRARFGECIHQSRSAGGEISDVFV